MPSVFRDKDKQSEFDEVKQFIKSKNKITDYLTFSSETDSYEKTGAYSNFLKFYKPVKLQDLKVGSTYLTLSPNPEQLLTGDFESEYETEEFNAKPVKATKMKYLKEVLYMYHRATFIKKIGKIPKSVEQDDSFEHHCKMLDFKTKKVHEIFVGDEHYAEKWGFYVPIYDLKSRHNFDITLKDLESKTGKSTKKSTAASTNKTFFSKDLSNYIREYLGGRGRGSGGSKNKTMKLIESE